MDALTTKARNAALLALLFATATLFGCKAGSWPNLFPDESATTTESGEPRGIMALGSHKGTRGNETASSSEEQRRAIDAMSSPDPAFRVAGLRSLVQSHDPRAVEFLQKSLDDRDPIVKAAAAAGLAQLTGREAKAIVADAKANPEEFSRVAAYAALDAAGVDRDKLADLARQSIETRRAAADALAEAAMAAEDIRDESVAAAQQLIRDASIDVQVHAVEAVGRWPILRAAPLLFVALESGGRETRSRAAARLAQQWPAAGSFPVDGDENQRRAAIANLKARWTAEHPEGR